MGRPKKNQEAITSNIEETPAIQERFQETVVTNAKVEEQQKTQTPEEEEFSFNCIPPIDFTRNGFGLYEHLDYVFDEDGYVDWRKMIEPKFLVPNKEKTKETDISKIDDKDLLILLGGIKKLAKTRGYMEVVHDVIVATPDYAAVRTTIHWRGNYETDGKSVSFSSLADAHANNTQSFARAFLTATAENRGFVRCVRNFLGINIVGSDEVGGKNVFNGETNISPSGKPSEILSKLLSINGISFEAFKNRMIKDAVQDAESWGGPEDIKEPQIYEIISIVQERIEKKRQEQKEKDKKVS